MLTVTAELHSGQPKCMQKGQILLRGKKSIFDILVKGSISHYEESENLVGLPDRPVKVLIQR